MTPQELKISLLGQAFQGKMVAQIPEEGTGMDLFPLLQEECTQKIKAGIIKKFKSLPPISEEEVEFELPSTWSMTRLGSVCQLLDGEKRCNETFPYLEARYLRGKTEATILNEGKYVSEGTNVILVDGENSGEVFRIPENGYMGSTFKVLFVPETLLLEYVIYFLQYHKSTLRNNKKGAAIPHLNKDIFFNLVIPLPPLAEQKRIVAKIEELLPYIDRYEKAWSRLEDFNKRFPVDMQKSILQMAIQGKLVEQRPEEGTGEELYQQIQAEKQKLIKAGKIKKEKPLPEITEDEVPFDIPESWKWLRLGEISYFQGGYAYKSTSYVPDSNNQIIRLGNVKQNRLLLDAKPAYIPDSIAETTEAYLIKKNDLLVTMTGTRRKKDYLFVARIEDSDLARKKLFINQRVGCFRCFSGMDPAYLQLVLQEESIRNIIFEKETGTANQGNLGSEDMKMYIYVPIPPLTEQKRIVAKLEQILPLCERLK